MNEPQTDVKPPLAVLPQAPVLLWPAAGFEDILLRWKMQLEVTAIQCSITSRCSTAQSGGLPLLTTFLAVEFEKRHFQRIGSL